MPQMSPMPWIILLIFTLLSLITISSIIYFTTQKLSYFQIHKNTNKFNFKW